MKKYIEVDNILRVNELVELGYKVHTARTHTYQEDNAGRMVSKDLYLMSLSSEKAYDNIESLKDIHPDEATRYLDKGWIVADSWSKIIRMVRKVETT